MQWMLRVLDGLSNIQIGGFMRKINLGAASRSPNRGKHASYYTSCQQKQSRQKPPAPKDFDEHMTWRIRWYLTVAITTAYTLSVIGGLAGYWITKDPHYLFFIAPTALIPFVRYLVPMDKKRYDLKLKLAQINNNKGLAEAKLQVQMLEAELSRQQANKTETSVIKR